MQGAETSLDMTLRSHVGVGSILHAFVLVTLLASARGQPGRVVTGNLDVKIDRKCEGTAQACTCQNYGPEPRPVYKLNLTLRLPSNDSGPAPVIIFFHGYGGKFVLHTGDYEPYGDAATGAGFAFLEYDVQAGGGLLGVLVDAIEEAPVKGPFASFKLMLALKETGSKVEIMIDPLLGGHTCAVEGKLRLQLQFLPKILEWLEEVNQLPDTPAHGKLDAHRIAVAGHSRGGKLAALHFTSGNKDIFAAFLVDPVDCPCFAPCSSVCYPSALEAVAASKKPIGVSGALVKGCCNPTPSTCGYLCEASCYAATGNRTCTGNDFEDFLYAGAGGSQGHSQAAGHLQFSVPTSATVRVLGNLFCGSDSSVTNQEVSSKAARHMMEWITSQLPALT